MKVKDIREMTAPERESLLADLKKEKFNLAIQAKTGQLEKTARVRQVRRDIAKIMTVMTEINAAATVKE